MGFTVRCQVLARRHGSGRAGSTYSYASVVAAPDDLPDGEYAVRFDGFVLYAVYRHGTWVPHAQPARETVRHPLAA